MLLQPPGSLTTRRGPSVDADASHGSRVSTGCPTDYLTKGPSDGEVCRHCLNQVINPSTRHRPNCTSHSTRSPTQHSCQNVYPNLRRKAPDQCRAWAFHKTAGHHVTAVTGKVGVARQQRRQNYIKYTILDLGVGYSCKKNC